MGRTEEFTARKHNKAARKRSRASDGSDLAAEEHRAAKKRRRKGVRRITEGMCYSLPTVENPFNERGASKFSTNQRAGNYNDRDGDNDVSEDDMPKLKAPAVPAKKVPAKQKPKIKKGAGSEDAPPVRKIFWPVGAQGRAQLAGPHDPRLPPHFLEAYAAVLGGNGASGEVPPASRGSSASSAGNGGRGTTGQQVAWGPLEVQCWQGCLAGQDVIVASQPHAGGGGGDFSGQVSGSQLNGHGSSGEISSVGGAGAGRGEEGAGRGAVMYGPPLVVHVKARGEAHAGQGPFGLVIVPSQEHAQQLRKAWRGLKSSLGLRSVCVHEASDIESQAAGLESQAVEVLIGTAPRVAALLTCGALSLSRVSFLVLDRADEVVAAGHGPALFHIRTAVSGPHQALCASATWPAPVWHLAQHWLRDPVVRAAGGGSSPLAACACMSVSVSVFKCHLDTDREDTRVSKVARLVQDVRSAEHDLRAKTSMLLLARDPSAVQLIMAALLQADVPAAALPPHAVLDDDSTLQDFRSGKLQILVATYAQQQSAASDFPLASVKLLVLFDFPTTAEAFEALLGQVARRTRAGRAFAFLPHTSPHLAPPVVDFLMRAGQEVDPALAMLARAFCTLAPPQALAAPAGGSSAPIGKSNGKGSAESASLGTAGSGAAGKKKKREGKKGMRKEEASG